MPSKVRESGEVPHDQGLSACAANSGSVPVQRSRMPPDRPSTQWPRVGTLEHAINAIKSEVVIRLEETLKATSGSVLFETDTNGTVRRIVDCWHTNVVFQYVAQYVGHFQRVSKISSNPPPRSWCFLHRTV